MKSYTSTVIIRTFSTNSTKNFRTH